HMGKHYKLRYVNPWPTPVQQPHPPIWIPGAGSYETMDFVARRRWAYMGIPYFHKRVFKKNFDYFREACEKEGYTASPEQIGWLGVGNVLSLLQLGTLPADLTRRNMELFASEVLPHLRDETGMSAESSAAAIAPVA